MILTKEQWFVKLKKMVPKWVFEEEENNVAIFKGMAAVIAQSQIDANNLFKETFLDESSTVYLDWHGKDRNKVRLLFEKNIAYSQRMKNIINESNLDALKEIVNSLLIQGTCRILDNYKGGNFFGRDELFLNRDIITYTVYYNAFTIIVDEQILTPETFNDRENFYNRIRYWARAASECSK